MYLFYMLLGGLSWSTIVSIPTSARPAEVMGGKLLPKPTLIRIHEVAHRTVTKTDCRIALR